MFHQSYPANLKNIDNEKNVMCIEYDYANREKVMIINKGVDSKATDKCHVMFSITKYHSNGTIRVNLGHMT